MSTCSAAALTTASARDEAINSRANSDLENDISDVREEIHEFIDFWQSMVEKARSREDKPLCFGKRYMINPPSEDGQRLFRQYNAPGKDGARETLTSMRNVDTAVKGSVIIWEDENG